jgi:hypothetical protein
LKLKLLISFALLIVGTFSLTAQSYSYSYADPCTGNTQTITVPVNGEVTVGYYGFVETFSYNEFNNGTFDTWTNTVFSQFEGSPCAEIVGLSSTVSIAQDAVFNVMGILNSLTALSDFAGASGATDMLTGSIGAASNSSGSSEDEEENNEGNGSSNNQTGQTSTGSNQVGSGTSSGEGTGGSTGESPAGNGVATSTQTGSNETGSTSTGQSVNQGGSAENSNNQTANGNSNQGNESNGSGNTGGNGNGGTGNGTSETSQEGQESGVNNNNSENNQSQNESGNNGSNSGGSGSSNPGSSEGGGQPGGEESTTEEAAEGGGQTNITAGANKTINANKEGGGAPTVIASSDFVGFNFKNSEVTTGLKLTGGYHSLRWDGLRAKGVLVDYVSAIKGPNATTYYAWVKPKSISMLSLTGTFGFEGRGSMYGTIAGGQMLMFPKVKNLKAVYMGTISYGQVYKTEFLGSALIAGGMYDLKLLKRIDVKIMGLFVYVPYISYYNDLVLKSPYVVIPSLGTNISITKRFKFNINAGGAWAIKENALNYTITCGTRLLVGQ